MEPKKERSEYYGTPVCVMNCTHGNFDHRDGDRCVILTVAKGSRIEHLAFPLDDAKRIATGMLVALATYDDTLAKSLLDDHFAADMDGHFFWPDRPLGT